MFKFLNYKYKKILIGFDNQILPQIFIKFNFDLLLNFLIKILIYYKFFINIIYYKKFYYKTKLFILFYNIIYEKLKKLFIKNIIYFQINSNIYNFNKFLLKLNLLNLPIFNLVFKTINFNLYLYKYINCVIITKFFKFIIKSYFINLDIFNLYFKKYNLYFFFMKKFFIFYNKFLYFYNNNFIILNINFNFKLKLFKNLLIYKISLIKSKFINKLLILSNNNTILISNLFIKTNLKNQLKTKFIKINFKKFQFNKIFINPDYKILTYIFDIYQKIFNIIILNFMNYKKFLKIELKKILYFYKYFINKSILNFLYYFNKQIIFDNLGSSVILLNRLNNLFLILWFYKIKYNLFYNIDHYFKFIKLYFINENLFNKNFSKCCKNYFFINLLYNFIYLFCIYYKNKFNNDLFSIDFKIKFICNLIANSNFQYNIYWLFNIVYIEFVKIYIFDVKLKLIYNHFISRLYIKLCKNYNKNLVNSVLIFRPIKFNTLLIKLKILKKFYKKNFFTTLLVVNNRLYKLLLKLFNKNLNFSFWNLFLINLWEKKLYYIFNKKLYDFKSYYIFINLKYIMYNKFYFIYFINNLFTNVKIKFKIKEIFNNRLILIFNLYKILNCFINLNSIYKY